MQVFCILVILLITVQSSPEIPEGKWQSLHKLCLEKSKCLSDIKCQIELEHCQRCEKEYGDQQEQYQKNKANYECYSDCLYNNVDAEENDEISEQAFDLLHCLEQKIFSLQELQTPKVAYVIKNHHLVKKAFKKYPNWTLVDSPQYSAWNLKWDFYHKRLNYNNAIKYQMGNKIENLQEVMGNKVSLLNLLRKYDENGFYQLNSKKFFPKTFVVDLKQSISDEESQLYQEKSNYWIIKNPSGYGGEGIIILKTMDKVKSYIRQQKEVVRRKIANANKEQLRTIETNAIIQKYIENPLLLNKKKFDIRNFVLVACTDPFLVLYHDGYFRQTLEDFDMQIEPWDKMAKIKHLTNSHMQSLSSKWQNQKLRNEHGLPYKESMDVLQKSFQLSEDKIKQMNKQQQDILAYTFTASLDILKRYPGSFHLTGMDFMFDDDLNMIFLEANQNPRIQEEFKGEAQTSPYIAQSTIDIVLQVLQVENKAKRTRMLKNVDKYFDLQGWTVLINEASGYNILDDENYEV